jgi:MtrB/PioB family decaheme-associated outer membrane protein
VNVLFTARPQRKLNLKARYRFYRYDNQTDILTFPGHVENDVSLSSEPRIAARNEYTRQNASIGASYRLDETKKLELGYEWENWNRNDVREVSHLNEHTGSAKLRLRPKPWAEIRGGYSLSLRNGNDYDSTAYIKQTHIPPDVPGAVLTNVFPALRKFPQADRLRNQVDVLATLVPTEDFSITLNAAYGHSDYNDTDFGLTDELGWNVGFDAEYRHSERVGYSIYYTFDDVRRKQRSRERPRNFVPPIVVVDDPNNNWSSRSSDRAHNFGVTMDAILIPRLLDAKLSWDYQSGKARTRASGSMGAAVDYPSIKDNLQTISATFSYQLREEIELTAGYRFERFNGSKFQADDQPLLSTFAGVANGLFLLDAVDDYDAHIFVLSMKYRF